MPRGGSTVILDEFCRMATGNFGLGKLVSQSRNCGCTLFGSMFSTIRSSVGIQLGARWQFWKKTQVPRSVALRNMASARGPWPWPSEMAASFFPNFIPSANLYKSAAGSVPVDSTNTSGVSLAESSYTAPKLALQCVRQRWESEQDKSSKALKTNAVCACASVRVCMCVGRGERKRKQRIMHI